MWSACLLISACVLVASVFLGVSRKALANFKVSRFKVLFFGAFVATTVLFLPIDSADGAGFFNTLFLSVFHAMQVFTVGCDFETVKLYMSFCPEEIFSIFALYASFLFMAAPVLTFGAILSFFKNIFAYLGFLCAYFKEVYIFSELNEKSIILAGDIRKNHKNSVVVFTDVFEENKERTFELIEKARKMGAICFKKDILVINFKRHSKKPMHFFTIGNNEAENINQTLKLIESYKKMENVNIYLFSTNVESELLLASVDKGNIKVRRINEVKSLVNNMLYEKGNSLFEKGKTISAVVVGMGNHGTEIVKALTWFCQMDGFNVEINAFDKDILCEEKFSAKAPELMAPEYNGVFVEGEAQYKINIHSGIDVETKSFIDIIKTIKNATYVIIALGDDDKNITTAVNLRTSFERMKIKPVIQAIVYNTQHKKALENIKNYRGQAYDIELIGDIETSYGEKVILDSALEQEAKNVHLKWGEEEDFWRYEYNYRSSMASAIHKKARIMQGISGADKKEEDLTEQERNVIERLEHRRWNAYMRAEGYVYSGSKDKSSRNDLAKMHHDLVEFNSLCEEDKRKDSKVGTN